MRENRLRFKKIIFLILLTSINMSTFTKLEWKVKVVNETSEKITVTIHSSQKYPGADLKLKMCGFKNKTVEPNSSKDFKYKDVNPVCAGPCTKLVKITSPVTLSAKNPLTSCSSVIVVVKQDESGKWSIKYKDWTDDALSLVEERKKMPLAVRKMCDKLSDSPIQSLSVFRQPIQAGVNELITALTSNEMKKLNYDDLYHTGLIVQCQDQLIKLERAATILNEVIKEKDLKELELRPIELPQPVTYEQFLAHAMKDDPTFWKYHPVTNNCQLFVLQCLEENGVEISEDLYAFIYQDAAKVMAKRPGLQKFATGVTSLSNRIDNLIEKADTKTKKLRKKMKL